MMLRGYRSGDRGLLRGPWLPEELLGLPPAGRPALAADTELPPPADRHTEVCVVPGVAVVRFAEVDWVHRRARLEIGVRPEAADAAGVLVKTALGHGFGVLALHRLWGWVTPAAQPPIGVLLEAGLTREATVPHSGWLAGAPVSREVWGVVRDA